MKNYIFLSITIWSHINCASHNVEEDLNKVFYIDSNNKDIVDQAITLAESEIDIINGKHKTNFSGLIGKIKNNFARINED